MAMITIQKASEAHIDGIIRVCTAGYRFTYKHTHTQTYIERITKQFYNEERVRREVSETSRNWGGYYVALDGERVTGAGGGGLTSEGKAEIYVMYIDPDRRNEGIGSLLLDAITDQQKRWGALEQWVSVQEGNEKGIPFYKAKGFVEKGRRFGYGNTEDESYVSLRMVRQI